VKRLFVDMDGTLAVFTPVNQLETLYQEGYFANLKPIDNVVGAIKQRTIIKPQICQRAPALRGNQTHHHS